MLVGAVVAFPQDSTKVSAEEMIQQLKGQIESLNESFIETKNTVDAMKKIKLSGYIQTQFQSAEWAGGNAGIPASGQNAIGNFQGGAFPSGVASRFSVRRGRIKFNYDNDLTQYVLQLDVTQGGVGIKDAYLSVKEPWYRAVSLWMGVFDRPFGYEISFSSGARETPERSRMFQTLFPGERELGMKLEIQPEQGVLSMFNLKAGLFNGVLNTANENDNSKDFIGRLGVQLPFDEQGFAIDGGVSMYAGSVRSNSKYVFTADPSTKLNTIDSASTNVSSSYDRMYYGADLQLYYDVPGVGGMTLRGEFITGQQPGTSISNVFYNPSAANTLLYKRNFVGYYANFVLNLGLSNQFIAKYDVLDPNTDVDGNDIGSVGASSGSTFGSTALTYADIKFSTIGFGWVYHWDMNVKFVWYYEMISNETANTAATGSLAPFKEDVKDNVFTFRIQYRF
jgi:hypothetical protein